MAADTAATEAAHALSVLVTKYGSSVVLTALRDACRAAQVHATEMDTSSAANHWWRAAEAMQIAVERVVIAEKLGPCGLDQALTVVAEARS